MSDELVRSVSCPRCRRIMPLDSLGNYGVLMTLEDDDGIKMDYWCPQCKHSASPADWTSNVFAAQRTMEGTWLAMMDWERRERYTKTDVFTTE